MVMVKLKMRTIYKSFLSLIGLLIIIATILGIAYLFYDKVVDIGSDVEVTGSLSINYIDGKKFNVEDNMTLKFSVTNGSSEISYYNIGFTQVRGNGNYKILLNDELITEGILKSIDEITTNFISINAGETKLYTLQIENNSDVPLKGELNIRTKESKILTFADTILNNLTPSDNALSKVGVDIATENEGLIKSSDDIGISYYFRGNVTNNYVSFGDMLWRIVRINGDGTVRLVLNDVTDVLASYYSLSNPNFVYEESAMNDYLEKWLTDNFNDQIDYISNSKFCSDIGYDEGFNYNSYTRIMTNKIPTLNCLGKTFTNNIGLLTIDEVVLAGASPNLLNTNYYLYNPEIKEAWYTMSGARGSNTNINMFMIDPSGNLKTDVEGNLYRNVRPVINLVKNIEVEGTGTLEDPYKIVE